MCYRSVGYLMNTPVGTRCCVIKGWGAEGSTAWAESGIWNRTIRQAIKILSFWSQKVRSSWTSVSVGMIKPQEAEAEGVQHCRRQDLLQLTAGRATKLGILTPWSSGTEVLESWRSWDRERWKASSTALAGVGVRCSIFEKLWLVPEWFGPPTAKAIS